MFTEYFWAAVASKFLCEMFCFTVAHPLLFGYDLDTVAVHSTREAYENIVIKVSCT
jgi:hypothetical protein